MTDFIRRESSGAILLAVGATVALCWRNSPWSGGYDALLHTGTRIGTGSWAAQVDLHHVVNDGLMALFFLVVGLEIKRELVDGELSTPRQAALPAIAALGGMVVPATLYVVVTAGTPDVRGWGIPMATDIALALGVVVALGRRVPAGAKLFLLALAIVDDIGAILVIATVYSSGVSWAHLAGAVMCAVLVAGLVRWEVQRSVVFVVLGVAMWWFLYEAGVHATLAGVVMGLLTPVSRIEGIERVLHPWTTRVVVPVFAFANAGVQVGWDEVSAAAESRTAWGIVLGLVVGKPVGIVGAALIGRACGLRLPPDVRLRHLVGVGVLAGVGFTVSIFVTDLALEPSVADGAKLAVMVSSVVAAIAGAAVLAGSAGEDGQPRSSASR